MNAAGKVTESVSFNAINDFTNPTRLRYDKKAGKAS
jgi:hypothetical protein